MCWHGPDQGTQDTSGKKFRRCFRSVDFVSDASSTLVAMDEEAQPQIVHRRRLRPAHRATDEPRDPRSSRDVCACMTVGGLPGTPRAVSRRPRACIALSPLCDYTAGASPAEASGKSNGRPRPRRHAWPRERCVPADVGPGRPISVPWQEGPWSTCGIIVVRSPTGEAMPLRPPPRRAEPQI